MSGVVYLGTQRIEKVSQLIPPDSQLSIKGQDNPYVSRGGVKLKAALDHFKLIIKDRICLDVGVSSGGFTDCFLKEGAKKVYVLDVSLGQLDWSLRSNSRVTILDEGNFRYFDPAILKDPIDVITIDVSFISLIKVIPKAVEILRHRLKVPGPSLPVFLLVLVKPQFEVGKGLVGRGGIVRDKKLQKECVRRIEVFCREQGLKTLGALPSPITGRSGNQEYLLLSSFSLS